MTVAFQEYQDNVAGPTTPAFAGSISGNGGAGSDLIIAIGTYGSSETNAGFNDNFNSGAYSILLGAAGLHVPNFGGQVFQIGYKVCNAGTNVGAGSLAVSCTGIAPSHVSAFRFNGFVNTAQFPAADLKNNNAASGTTISTPSFNTSFANEYIFSWICSNDTYSNPIGTGWASGLNGDVQLQFNLWAANPVSIGTAAALNSITKSGSNAWVAFCGAFYDGVGGAPIVSSMGISSLGPG